MRRLRLNTDQNGRSVGEEHLNLSALARFLHTPRLGLLGPSDLLRFMDCDESSFGILSCKRYVGV